MIRICPGRVNSGMTKIERTIYNYHVFCWCDALQTGALLVFFLGGRMRLKGFIGILFTIVGFSISVLSGGCFLFFAAWFINAKLGGNDIFKGLMIISSMSFVFGLVLFLLGLIISPPPKKMNKKLDKKWTKWTAERF